MHHLDKVDEISTDGIDFQSKFAQDVFLGLAHTPKWLSSKYFYDEIGDKIFQEIMHMPGYYLTRAELDIFQSNKDQILSDINKNKPFKIIELGAGDGLKTKVLLKHLVEKQTDFRYAPCDISGHVLDILKRNLLKDIPGLNITPLEGDYFDVLADYSLKQEECSVILFLGSNIGNFTYDNALDFLRRIRANMKIGDLLMVGFDLKKEPDIILEAYDDPEGITARFNLNLLSRINRELEGDFDPDQFLHYASYDPPSGECRSYLISRIDQEVHVGTIKKSFHFKEWEPIFTEISKKFDPVEISDLAVESGFNFIRSYSDSKSYFTDVLWEAI